MKSDSRAQKLALPPPAAYGALFLVSLSSLLWEILLTRIYSAVFHYHFAFMAVSIAMFGMTAGAVAVLLNPRAPAGRLTASLGLLAFLTGLLMPFAITFELFMPLRGPSPSPSYLLLTYLLSALPFIPAGAFICLALTRFDRIGSLYAADLAGAAAACAVLPWLIGSLGGPGAAVAAGALAAAAAFMLLRPSRGANASLLCAITLAVFAAANAQGQWLRLRWGRSGSLPKPLYEQWNAFSRVVVSPIGSRVPFGWGIHPDILAKAQPVSQLFLDIDSGAASPITRFNGKLESLGYLKYDISSFAHWLRPPGEVFIIGPGGGRDILAALLFDHSRIQAVEVNPNILRAANKVFGDFSGHLDRLPQVRFAADEARSYLARTTDRYDIIQASLVDTAAATAAGAYALVENGLYTVEGWTLFLSRLKPHGILTFSRGPVEITRTVALATAALRSIGVSDPSRHIILVRARTDPPGEGIGTILVSPDPFSPADYARAQEACKEIRCDVIHNPMEPAQLQSAPLDFSAPTDDRPYFFFLARISDVLRGRASASSLPAVGVLITLSAWSVFLGLALTLIPPLWLARKGQWSKSASPVSLPLYFALIGLAFMFVEVGLIQRFSIFLGHPTLGFTVALFGILLASGLGSLASEPVCRTLGAKRPWLPLIFLVVVLATTDAASLPLTAAAMGAAMPVRILLALLLIAPPAVLMGFAFPMGMRVVQKQNDGRAAWYWAINGAFSVIASVLAMVCSLGWGIRLTLWTGIALYAAAAIIQTVL